MTKSKRQPKNFLRYFLDEFILFRRDFYFETTASRELLVTAFYKLESEERDTWFPQRIVPSPMTVEDSVPLELRSERPARHGQWVPNAKAEIFINDDANQSILEGSIVVRGKQYWASYIALFVIVSIMHRYSEAMRPYLLLIFIIFPFTAAFSWFENYRDRNHLYNLIESAVESAHGNDNETQAS